MKFRPLVGALGADCPGAPDSIAAEEILTALRQHGLLVFRDQRLTAQSFTRLAARLGELDVYPFARPLINAPHVVSVVKEPRDETNFGGAWHTDTSYSPQPPSVTLLYAVEVPDHGGDTLFADTRSAFDDLSPGFRRALLPLTGHNTAALVHGGAYSGVVGQSVALTPRTASSAAGGVTTEADHPLVIRQPGTGRPALFFSLIHTESIVGMTRAESLPLLRQLHRTVTRAENTTRLRWRGGTLAIWDNRAVMHYPLNDYPGKRREMQRIILKGDQPSRFCPRA